MAHREFKDRLYREFARIGKAVANPHRLELLDLLAQREWSVEDLAQETAMSIANASAHLKVLRSAQLVESRREGSYVYYRLADQDVVRLWQVIRDIGETRLAEVDRIVDQFIAGRDEFEPVDPQTVLNRLQDGDIILLDVRPRLEYDAGHLPGARSVPIEELESRLDEIEKDQEVIAYCRGRYCLFADEAVELLRRRGFRARRLDEGLPDWQVAGLPVERESA
jgi:rhodanese-related sulfurtransferase/DNA-binding MarR family transcriptional regulator